MASPIFDIKISPENLLPWSNMEDWSEGTSVAPTEHTLSGTGATIARESTIIKVGTYSAGVTRVGNDATLYYNLPSYADYLGRKMTFGCWVYATVASRARLSISDGVGSTNSSYHTGVTGWEFLTVTRNIDPSATRIRVEMQVNTGNTTAYFDNGILCEGSRTYTILTDISDVGNWTVANRYRGQEFKVARRVGMKVPTMQIESKTIQFEGMVVGATLTAMRSNHDTLQEVINGFRIKANGDMEMRDLYLTDDRLSKVFLNQNDPQNKAAGRVRDYKLRFVCPEPFEQYVNKTRTKQTLSASPTTFTVTNGGNAFTRPYFSVLNSTSNISSLVVENLTTGQSWAYTGSLVTGNSLTVDTDLFLVQNNAVDDITNFSGDLDMILLPGDNEIRVTGLVAGTIKVDHFNRWF